MRNATSGTHCPAVSVTWPIASQALATNTAYAPAHVACPGARAALGPCSIGARTALPRTAAGADPLLVAFSDADDFITWRATNNNANALVALGADVTIDIIQLPSNP